MNEAAAAPRPPARVLGSFHYWRRTDLTATLTASAAAGTAVDFLADSGAFSAHTSGASVTVGDYAAWLGEHAGVITAAITLDVIGDPDATATNTARLRERVGDRVRVLPVFHVGSPWPVFEQMCAQHPWATVGGAVAVNRRRGALLAWLVKAHRIAREHGTVLHGLGLTRPPYPTALPFYSTDSSYWTASQRTGTIGLFDPRAGRLTQLRVGTRGATAHASLIRAYGGDPAIVAAPGFGSVAAHGGAGRSERYWLAAAALASMLRYADHLRAVHGPISTPRGVPGPGPRLYLAAGSVADYRQIIAAHTTHHQSHYQAAVHRPAARPVPA